MARAPFLYSHAEAISARKLEARLYLCLKSFIGHGLNAGFADVSLNFSLLI